MKPVVGIDFDNVLVNTTESYLKLFNTYTSKHFSMSDITDWDMSKILPQENKGLYEDLWRSRRLWESVLPIFDAQTYLKLMCQIYTVYIVTNTMPDTTKWKYEIIKKYFPFIDKDQLIITKNKQIINLDVLIDDYQGNLAGGSYKKILIDYPWNANFETEEHGIVRVKSMSEAYHVLQEMFSEGQVV